MSTASASGVSTIVERMGLKTLVESCLVLLETRGDIAVAWLNRPPANPLSPQAVRDLISVWEEVGGSARALVIASSNIFTFSAGADIKEFTKMSPDAEAAELVESAHRFMRGMEQSSTV